MNTENLKTELFKKALEAGFEECEIYWSDSSSFSVSVYKGNIEKYQNSQSGGFCFRGLYNGKMGYYFSENAKDPDVDNIIKNAVENSEIISGGDKEFIYEGSEKYYKVNVYNDKIDNMTVEDKIQAALNMENAALEYDPRIKVNKAMISTGISCVKIDNTKGLKLEEKENYFMAYIENMAVDENETVEKGEIWIGRNIEEFDPIEIGRKAAEKAILALGGKPVESQKSSVIIKNEVFADILGCFCGSFFAENVQKGFSLLKDKLNSKIASDIVTLVDDPLLEKGNATASFDSEGVATYSKNVIEKGILKTYLYNLKTAAKDGVKSTGNGFKGSFKGSVNTSATNFYIEKGEATFEKMAEEVYEGIVITDVAGLHSGVNWVSGDFSVAAEGFKIEKGKITTPVNQITIASNFYDMLNDIFIVGNDIKFNTSSVGSPSIAVKNISIAGL